MGNLTDKPELNEKKGKIGNLDSPKNPFDYMKREYGTVPLDTKRAPFQWVSEVAYKNVHRIVSRGYDTTEVMEEGYGVVDMLFIDYQARIPTGRRRADAQLRHDHGAGGWIVRSGASCRALWPSPKPF